MCLCFFQAFIELAQLTKKLDIDLFHYSTPTHKSLKRALDWVAPFTLKDLGVVPNKIWPYDEETPFDHGKVQRLSKLLPASPPPFLPCVSPNAFHCASHGNDIGIVATTQFFQIFRMASINYGDSLYETMIPKLPGNVNYTTNVINLVWPKRAR